MTEFYIGADDATHWTIPTFFLAVPNTFSEVSEDVA